MLSSHLVRSVLDSAPDALVIVDASGAIVFSSRQVTALFGYEPAELSSRPIEHLLPERFRTRHVTHRRNYSSSVRVRPMGSGLDLFALRRDGTEFPVEISLSPITNDDGLLVVAAIRDITDRRAIQLDLRRAREEAERANQAKSRFLATASHDLRQPLQALALLNGTMRRMVGDEALVEALAQEELAISAMSRLLNALLDISKLESGAIKPELSDFKVAALFEELRAEFASLARSKGLRLEVEPCPELVHSDPSLVGQVIRNLLSNAIKYTDEGYVLLRSLHEPSCVCLEVLDTGIGIPAGELERIYDDFYQVGIGANASRDGYGLGLSIVSRIVKLLGLKLEVRSEPGKGSVFSLAVPPSSARAEAPGADASGGRARAHGPAPRARLLLVEDDPGVRNATRMLLKVEGLEVTTAASLSEAVEQATGNPDIGLLVTDYHLTAEGTGLDVLSAVRGVLGRQLKAVLVTGDTSSAMHELARDAHLRVARKPVNADELLSLVTELLDA
jgi:PAS domain S-box-containing protein